MMIKFGLVEIENNEPKTRNDYIWLCDCVL